MTHTRFVTLFALLIACGPGENDHIKNARSIEKEQTPENLIETGQSFALLGDTTRAEQYLAAALDRGADPHKVLPMLLEVCVRDGRFEMAIEYARPYLEKHPNDTTVRYLLATLYSAVGDRPKARAETEIVVESRPNEAEPHFLLGTLLRDEHDFVAADKHFRAYLRIAPQGAHSDEARGALLKSLPHVSDAPWDGGIPTPIGPIPETPVDTTPRDAGAIISAPDSGKRKEKP